MSTSSTVLLVRISNTNYYQRKWLLSNAGYSEANFKLSKTEMNRVKLSRSLNRLVASNYPLLWKWKMLRRKTSIHFSIMNSLCPPPLRQSYQYKKLDILGHVGFCIRFAYVCAAYHIHYQHLTLGIRKPAWAEQMERHTNMVLGTPWYSWISRDVHDLNY